MAERNQLPSALRGLNRRHPRHREHIALGSSALQHQRQHLRAHHDHSFRPCFTAAGRTIPHLHHVHLTGSIEVAQTSRRR